MYSLIIPILSISYTVCDYAADIKTAGTMYDDQPIQLFIAFFTLYVYSLGIRVVIVGVGSNIRTDLLWCLMQDDDDWFEVASFSDDDFDAITGGLSEIICPVTKEAKFTEIKAEKKEDTDWNNRWSRFVEFYNTGVSFNLQDVALSGLINMTQGDGPNVTVSQGQYVVFYDAADDSIVTDESTVSCHLCANATCDLRQCEDAGDSTSDEYCWCGKALYIACRNTEDECPEFGLPEGNNASAIDACDVTPESLIRSHRIE